MYINSGLVFELVCGGVHDEMSSILGTQEYMSLTTEIVQYMIPPFLHSIIRLVFRISFLRS